MSEKLRIKDIAHRSAVSTATSSRAWNDKPRVSEALWPVSTMLCHQCHVN
jgi:hypothetical protein